MPPLAHWTKRQVIINTKSPFYQDFCIEHGYPKLPKKIGEHIRKHRMDLELFQKDVTDIIGVSECTVYNWEHRGNEPEIKYMPKIIDFLGDTPFECPGDILEGFPTLGKSKD